MRIDISPGDATWEAAEPLLNAVWPPHVRQTLVWKDVVWSHASRRVLIRDEASPHDLLCHVGLFTRNGLWNDTPVTIGGIGGVATRPDRRKSGLATRAMKEAMACFASEGTDFAVLFCEPHNHAFYRGLGWHEFVGAVFCEQPQGQIRFNVMTTFVYDLRLAPRDGTIDLRGLPW